MNHFTTFHFKVPLNGIRSPDRYNVAYHTCYLNLDTYIKPYIKPNMYLLICFFAQFFTHAFLSTCKRSQLLKLMGDNFLVLLSLNSDLILKLF